MSCAKIQIPSQRPIYPTPAGLVTSVDWEGNPNIITLGEIYNLSIRHSVIVGDHDLFKGEVVVEHIDADLIDQEGNLKTNALDMLIFARWTFWTAGQQIGAVR